MNKKLVITLIGLLSISTNSFAMLGQARQWISKNFGSQGSEPSKSQTASSFASYLGSEQEFGSVSPEEALIQVKADAIDSERKKINSTINHYRARITKQPGDPNAIIMGEAMHLNEIINKNANIIKSLPEYEQKKVAQLIDTILESVKERFASPNINNSMAGIALIRKEFASEEELEQRYGISFRNVPVRGYFIEKAKIPQEPKEEYVSREYKAVPVLTMTPKNAPLAKGEPIAPIIVERPTQSWLSSAWKTISNWFSK